METMLHRFALVARILTVTLCTSAGLLALPQAAFAQEPCDLVKGRGYWGTHPGAWPIDTLALGNAANALHIYTRSDLVALLRSDADDDASRILAAQLIAAKLNVANGSNPAPIADSLSRADLLLGGFAGRLPYGVTPNTPVGSDMVSTARILDDYNSGRMPGSCGVTNRAPIAHAGPDQSAAIGSLVTLDGSASSDPDGNPLTFRWMFLSKPSGSQATLDNPSAVMPTFILDAAGPYELQLVVNDGASDSVPDTVIISNVSPPVANAGPDQTTPLGQLVQLDGSGSADSGGDLLTFSWTVMLAPPGSLAALSNPTAVNPTFVADVHGEYILQLIVSDGTLGSEPDTVTVSTVNSRPAAHAGLDQSALVGSIVTLNGSGSSDPDGDALTFRWSISSRPDGSEAALSDFGAVNPSLTIDRAGTYIVQLVVNDGTVDSELDTVTITTENSRPSANAGADQSVFAGSTVTVDGSGSVDVDGDPLAYRWSFTSVPPASTATLSDVTAVRPTFVVDQTGDYVAQLIVNDGTVDSVADTVTISTFNRPPIASAGPDQTVARGATVSLDGAGSSDPDGGALTFRWALTSVPVGSAAALSDQGSATPSFVADVAGTYVAQLIVNDGLVDSEPDTVVISTESSVPTANAGPDQAVATGATVQLDGSGSVDPDGVPLQFFWSLTSRPAGSTAVLSNPGAANPTFVTDSSGVYVAQLIVGDGVHQSDPDTAAITAQPGADLRLAFFGIPSNPPIGSTFNVGLDVRNDGPANADDVAILFQPPAGFTLTNVAVHFGGPYEQGSGTWSVGTLANGGLGRIILTLRANATGPHDLSASITNSSVPDPDPADNTVTAAITPDPNADLRLFFCTPPPAGTFAVGANTTWCLEIRNDGPAGTTGLNAQHVVPEGWTVTNTVVHFAGTYDQASGNWSVPALAVGGLSRLFITARVNATGATALHAAIIGSDQPDPDAADTIVTNPPINRPPGANAGADQAGSTHATVALDGSLTSDPEGDPLTLQWTFTLRPVNSVATLANANTAAPSFTPDQGGTYTAQLTVTDASGATSVDTVNITVAVLNNPPVIRSAPNTIGAIGQPYQYQVRADDPDAGDTLSFALPAAPSGMTIDPTAGAIAWVPSEDDPGPQQVTVRVQDTGGLFALQSFAVQVSSAGNRSPVAADDSFEVRVDESLGVAAPGVLQNDADETPLTTRLLTAPANGTLLFNNDGSFVYTPHTQRPGELVMAENVNLANRLPGVTVNASGFSFHGQPCGRPECAVDENPATSWSTHFEPQPFFELLFPLDVVLNRVEILGHRSPFLINLKITAGILQVFAADGRELYNSGNVELPLPARDATFKLNNLTGARRVRFSPTAGDGNSVLSRGFAELKVIGSALVRRELVPEPNVARLLPATVQASSVTPPNQPEALIDESSANWYAASAQAGEFVQITLPQDATVTRIESANPSGRPDGFGTSLPIDCSGSFTLLDLGGNVLFDSGVVNTPTGGLSSSITFSLDTGVVAGVRRLRYTTTGCSGFPLGFSEIRLFGTADVEAPAFALGEKFQSLFGREIHSTPIVINLTDDNFDGAVDARDVPDIVVPVESSSDQLRGEIKAISGADGTVLFTAGSPNLVSPWSELAAGDLDGDGLPEIVAVHGDRNHLIAFDHTGGVKWTSDAHSMPQFSLGSGVGVGAVTLANLDGAGPPEVIIGASVFDSEGRLRGDGRTLGGTTGGTGLRSAIPAVGDIDLDGVPELVAGPTAYRLADTLTRVWQRPDRTDGFVGIANLDDDPTAEIVIVANGSVYALDHDGSDAEVWNPPSRAPVAIPGGGQGGAPLIVDVDGDGRPEIGVAGAVNYVLFNRDGSIRWQSVVRDRSSHSTGSIAFDLDGDGRVEIIYRDEFFLRIYRGSDGVLLAKTSVGSSTWAELPVIADVDNDGHADLIVSSDFLAQAAGEIDTGIIVLQDAANKWARTRRIWNQHAYHVTNVNEDGSIPLVATPHWLVPGLNNFRTNAFPAVANGDRVDRFTYVASDGVLESNVATVHITVRTPNAGPQITSTAATSAAHGVRYSYAVIASDPDPSDLLTFSLPSAPPGMLIDALTGLIQWVPADTQAGSHDVIVKVEDLRGLYAVQGFSVTVADPILVPDVRGQSREAAASTIGNAGLAVGAESTRHSPTIPAGAVLAQSPSGGTLAAPQSAVNLVVSLGHAPAGTVPDLIGMAQAAAAADIAAAGFAVGAVSGQNHATVPANIVLAQNPVAGSIADLASAIDLIVSVGPPPGEIDGDGDGFTGDQGDCNDSDPAIHPGAIDLPGDAIDQNCNGADSIAGDQAPPTAQLVAPADLSEVTMPTDVVGTVADVNLLRYTVQLAEVDATTFTVIGSGTAGVTAGVVGRIDPTLLENGLYRVRLIAEDVNGQVAIDERVYSITGEAKVGLAALSFVDVRVPVSGIPITVLRTYDSRVKSRRDFGIGWTLQVKAGRYQNNRLPGDGWVIQDRVILGEPVPCIGGSLETRSHLTEVRLSDREYYRFTLRVDNENLGITGACEGVARFQFVDGTMPGATLQILDGTDVIYLRAGPDRLLDMNDFLDGVERVYEPRRVRLTTIDGRRIDLSLTRGTERIEDINGNALTITDAGIAHGSGRSIAFTRDEVGRITRITDPLGLTLQYAYTDDDLTEVTDQTGAVTTFAYDERHNLVEMRDPLGNRAVFAEYDVNGRLIAITDARGIRTGFNHDVTGREEIITDGLGHATRVVYDDSGHVTSRETSVTIDGTAVLAGTQYQYDAQGNETTVVDPDGIRADGAYEEGNLLEEIVDPAGLRLRTVRTYDARGEMLTQIDPAGTEISFAYDARGNLTGLSGGANGATAITYDAAGQPLTGTDALGNKRRLAYDSSGRVVREEQLDPAGSVLTRLEYTYDANGNRLTATELRTVDGVQQLLTTRFAYDARNRLVASTNPLGGVTRIEYNELGLESARLDALGRRTSFTYDEVGALVRTDFPDGTFESQTYDAVGNVVSIQDRAGRVTAFGYDELKRRVLVTRPDSTSTRTIYTPGGRIQAEIDARGNRTDHEYDGAGRRIRTRQPAVVNAVTGLTERPEINYEYDAAGRVTAIVDANAHRTTFTFDGLGRLTGRGYADGTSRQSVYDAAGRLIEERDEAGRLTQFGHDALSRLARVTDPLGGATTYTYDEAGRLLTQRDALGRATSYVRDALGRVTGRRLPGGGTETFSYDAVGNTTAHTDFNGATVLFTYDAMDRLIRRIYPGGIEHAFTYTPTGQRATTIDPRGTTTYEYSVADQLTRVTHPGGATIQYAYDADGHLRRMESGSAAVDYSLDGLGRIVGLDAVVNGSAMGTVRFGHDLAGNVVSQVRPNGVTTTMTYDSRNRLTAISHLSGVTTLASFTYQLSLTGRRTQVNEAGGGVVHYGYDALDRIISEVREGVLTASYQYDAVGNRIMLNRNGATTSYTYDVDDRLLAAGPATYAYDANGNLVSRTFGGATTNYEWNRDNRLVRTAGAAGTAEFTYDVDGNRVAKRVGADVVDFLVDANSSTGVAQVIEERNALGAQAQYTYGGTGLVAATRSSGSAFYQADALGSTRLLTDATGAVTDTYQYEAFGALAAVTGSTPNPYQFAGERFDPAIGLYNLRARNYDSAIGRFVGRDPLRGRPEDPRSQHPYAYAHGDPVNLTDPTGLFTLLEMMTTVSVQDVLHGLDLGRSVVQFCAVTGKIEIAQEALFWGQFAAAGPILANELFGQKKPGDASLEITLGAKRFLNVFKSPEKIVEAKLAVELNRKGDRKLGAELKREDGVTFGGTFDLVNPQNSSFKTGAGAVSFEFSPGNITDSNFAVKKAIDIFKTERCSIELIKGSLEVGGKLGLAEQGVSAAFVLEALQGLVKFSYPFFKLP
jgi:RHS repeat-associated protein